MQLPLTPVRFLRYAREQFPEKIGIICEDQRFTYAQFAERSARLANALRDAGAAPGDRIAFLSANCHRLLEAYYGVLEASCILLPLNIRLSPEELAFVLNDAGARFLFLEPLFLPLAEALRPIVPSIESFVLLEGRPTAPWIANILTKIFFPVQAPQRLTFFTSTRTPLRSFFIPVAAATGPKESC